MENKSRRRQLQFRVDPSEEQKIMEWATISGMSLSEYLRRVSLRGITFKMEEQIPEVIHVESITVKVQDDKQASDLREHGGG